jgi:hypothetical protein
MLPKSDRKPELGGAHPFLERFVQSLHELPPVVRYYDDFDDETRSISNIRHSDMLPLHVNGRRNRLSLAGLPESYRTLIKHLLVFMLGEDLHISTCSNVLGAAIHFSPSDIEELVEASPTRILSVWMTLRARELPAHAYHLVKALLRFKCRHRWGGWSESYVAFVSHQLPNPAADAYARVRSGDVFLGAEAEAAIVRHIDRFAARLRADRLTLFPDYSELCDVSMTLCAYQFAMRPIQIAMLTQRDVRIWRPDPDGDASVHLTFLMAKQRGTSKNRPMVRRVKHEWGVVIEATVAAATAQHRRIDGRLFDVDSNHEAGKRIAGLVERLTGDDASAMYLRHTAKSWQSSWAIRSRRPGSSTTQHQPLTPSESTARLAHPRSISEWQKSRTTGSFLSTSSSTSKTTSRSPEFLMGYQSPASADARRVSQAARTIQ